MADLLLELLVDGIERILDGDTFEVPSCYLQAQREVQVNLFYRGSREHFLQRFLVVEGSR